MSRKMHVLFVLTVVSKITAAAIQQFGSPAFSKAVSSQTDVTWKQMLLPSAVTLEGNVFAFSAVTSTIATGPFDFQIFRSQSGSSGGWGPINYMLMYSLTVTPSVLGQREIFYLDSYLGTKKYFHVLPGDLLGIYFYTYPLGLSCYFDPSVPSRTSISFQQADAVTPISSSSFLQPNFVDAFGYYENGTSTTVTAGIGLALISYLGLNLTQPVPTTTYVPPVGATGPRGATGPKGSTGSTGPVGQSGLLGSTGDTGNIGVNGLVGSPGSMGPANLVKGVNGTMGLNGSTGFVGFTGSAGALGSMGINGSMGLGGSNETITVYGPLNDLLNGPYFVTYKSVRGLFIWLAIDSFAFLVAVVALIIAYRFHSQFKQDLEKCDESIR